MRALLPFVVLFSVPATAAVMRDPTAPPHELAASSESGAAAAAPKLTSVLISPERRLAIIDGRTYTEGTERNGIRLEEVRRGGATVIVRGERMDLELAGHHMTRDRSQP